MPVIPAKTTANASIPSNAPEAPPEKLLRITVVAVSTNNNSDIPAAVANVELGSKSLSRYKIPAIAPTTKVITPNVNIALLLTSILLLRYVRIPITTVMAPNPVTAAPIFLNGILDNI